MLRLSPTRRKELRHKYDDVISAMLKMKKKGCAVKSNPKFVQLMQQEWHLSKVLGYR